VLFGPLSPLLARFFRAKRAVPTRLGPLRAELGQRIKPAAQQARPGFLTVPSGPGPKRTGLHRARAGPGRVARLALSNPTMLPSLEY
jgi:hypothetical protein